MNISQRQPGRGAARAARVGGPALALVLFGVAAGCARAAVGTDPVGRGAPANVGDATNVRADGGAGMGAAPAVGFTGLGVGGEGSAASPAHGYGSPVGANPGWGFGGNVAAGGSYSAGDLYGTTYQNPGWGFGGTWAAGGTPGPGNYPAEGAGWEGSGGWAGGGAIR